MLPEDYCKEDPRYFLWDMELARNWPRVGQLLSNPVYKILPWRFRAVVLRPRACTKSGWLEVDQELDMGCQLLTRTFPCWFLAGIFLAEVLWQHPNLLEPMLGGGGRKLKHQILHRFGSFYPKNHLRLFWRNNLKGYKEKPPKLKINLRIAVLSLFYSVFFRF